MRELSTRTGSISDSIIRRMTRVCSGCGAVNLSQGFPDFDPPEEITGRLKEVAVSGPHQYAITWGSKHFRDALCAKQKRFMGMDFDPETEVVVTCGSTEAMMCAMMTVVNPGDKVIVFSPFYENYGADAILSGAQPVYVPLLQPAFTFDPETLENAFRQGAKALVLCNPSNPTGHVFTRDELMTIARLAEKYDAYVLTDEVYEHIVYEPYRHIYFASLPGMRERTLSISSLSKTYSITGWRIGYILGPERIIERAKKVHDFLTVGAPAPLMEAVCAGLELPDSYYRELQAHYTHMKNLFCGGLSRLGLHFVEPQGAYYVLVDISEYHVKNDVKFCYWLAQHVGVGAVPGSSFFAEDVNNLIRLHFAKKDETLSKALENLSRLPEMASQYDESAYSDADIEG